MRSKYDLITDLVSGVKNKSKKDLDALAGEIYKKLYN